eukprot:TRINITY_DN12704_c0_g2_i1.p1 TRINITY_DN12704_c0_g2~~TRINITY_DN12704_c0_g2_i1.p1  ORF type:complete len:417 (-),score=75.81 TRINITY_DN12704_c0_g2_i1:96-1346(-)
MDELQQIVVPENPGAEWVVNVKDTLLAASFLGVDKLQEVLTYSTLKYIVQTAQEYLEVEPALVELELEDEEESVVIVGDTHGQYHDVCHMLNIVGDPCETNLFVWNGDYVDRGAWGVELLTLLLCWKIVLPEKVLLLRGNHETVTCTEVYGFQKELEVKYGRKDGKSLYKLFRKLFAHLPLAAVINDKVLVLHGGLFRQSPQTTKVSNKKRRKNGGLTTPKSKSKEIPQLGSLQDLKKSGKGGQDPDGVGNEILATDVLWSDPMKKMGMKENKVRGVGMLFGPDITRDFLSENELELIIRSHEGPDARLAREDMPDVLEGFSEDHVTNAGKLITLFSAPDYPQFQDSDERTNNKGAVARIRLPNITQYEVIQYKVQLRPKAQPYYNYIDALGSDEDIEIGGGYDSEDTEKAMSDHS